MSDYELNHIPQKDYYLVGQKCVVFNSDGKILLLKRSDKSGGAGWSLVGGGLEPGEDPIEGIKREAKEEAQLEIDEIKPIHLISFKEGVDSVLMVIYQAKTNSSDVILNWEHDEYKWVTKEEALDDKELSELIKELIKHSSLSE